MTDFTEPTETFKSIDRFMTALREYRSGNRQCLELKGDMNIHAAVEDEALVSSNLSKLNLKAAAETARLLKQGSGVENSVIESVENGLVSYEKDILVVDDFYGSNIEPTAQKLSELLQFFQNTMRSNTGVFKVKGSQEEKLQKEQPKATISDVDIEAQIEAIMAKFLPVMKAELRSVFKR